MKSIIVTLVCLVSFSATAQYSGAYKVKKGFSETLSVSATEQLGKMRVVLKSENRSFHSKNKIVIVGALRGTLNPADLTLSHILVNKDRTGTIYTAGDTITVFHEGDQLCSSGIPFVFEERLNIVKGSGIYSGVQYGSYIDVKGVVNNCPELPEYGRNDFEVIGGSVNFE